VFEREEGAFLGSLAINFGVTSITFIAVLVTWIALTLPDPPVVLITAASVAIAVVLPLVIYPFAKTMWTAIDILMRWDQRRDVREFLHGRPPEAGSSER
jgi:Na+/phosphate symporter